MKGESYGIFLYFTLQLLGLKSFEKVTHSEIHQPLIFSIARLNFTFFIALVHVIAFEFWCCGFPALRNERLSPIFMAGRITIWGGRGGPGREERSQDHSTLSPWQHWLAVLVVAPAATKEEPTLAQSWQSPARAVPVSKEAAALVTTAFMCLCWRCCTVSTHSGKPAEPAIAQFRTTQFIR